MRGEWGRRLPPLLSGAMALALALVLPSALNVPVTNPSQTLEFAPVPPQDDAPPQVAGNLGSLSLGGSSTVDDGGLPGGAPTPPPPDGAPGAGGLPPPGTPGGTGGDPVSKRCVGNPPRQTEDPMSPPCVAHFEGDNGGATAKGVTAGEVTVLVYVEANPIGLSVGLACHDQGCDENEFYDLSKPENQSSEGGHDEREAYWPHVWRVWQTHFNERYQTYGRKVHFWVHYGSPDHSPESRRADVAEAASRLEPFAVIADVNVNAQVYADEWARRGKVVFMTKTSSNEAIGNGEEMFRKYPGSLWSFSPSREQLADTYGDFLCKQVVGHPVSFAGDGSVGQPRKLGLLLSRDPNTPAGGQHLIDYGKLIDKKLRACGADIVSREYFDTASDGDPAAAQMRLDGVTTVIYMAPGGSSAYGRMPAFTDAVARQQPRWRPELLFEEDNVLGFAQNENQDVVRYARNVSVWPRAYEYAGRPCVQAYSEIEPDEPVWYESWTVCFTFNDARMLFTGIQVAGPKLSRETLDQGMHAIPDIPSGDPSVPACFYEPGDYTCVKDAQVSWWHPTDKVPGARSPQPGCWKLIDDGKRYLAGDWPDRDVDARRRPARDRCNLQGTAY